MDKITLKGFKGIKERVDIDLKNLTILFGYNNSGKSSILRMLPTISDSFKDHNEDSYTSSYLNYQSKSLRGAIHTDIINSNYNDIEIGVHWGTLGIQVSLRQSEVEPEKVNKFILFKEGASQNFRTKSDEDALFESDNEEEIIFKDFHSISDEAIRRKIYQTSRSVSWISSIRESPPREFKVGLGVKKGIDFKGQGLGQTLWYIKKHNTNAFDQINEWLQNTTNRKLVLDSSTRISAIAGCETVTLQTTSTEANSPNVNIIDSGEGLTQALPVVTLCAMAANGMLGAEPIIAIEQPELHLHPKAIIILADFLIKIIEQNNNVKLVIETHSESFLLAIQTAIVKRDLEFDNLACYWVDKDEDGTQVSNITFDEEGFIEGNWPQSVFREIIGQSKELLRAREESV